MANISRRGGMDQVRKQTEKSDGVHERAFLFTRLKQRRVVTTVTCSLILMEVVSTGSRKYHFHKTCGQFCISKDNQGKPQTHLGEETPRFAP